jgi:tetratricopeptide (TPR) repeat protein
MRTLAYLILFIVFVEGHSQKKIDCNEKIEAYRSFLNQSNLKEAFEPWDAVRKNCPSFSEEIYTDGFVIYDFRIQNATPETKEKEVRGLMALYDQYHNYFPKAIQSYEVIKAMLLYQNKIDAKEEMLQLFNNGFAKASNHIDSPNAFYVYFSMCTEKFKAQDPNYSAKIMTEKYVILNALLVKQESVFPDKASEFKTAGRAINGMAKDIATCENLSAYYENAYESFKDEPDLLQAALNAMTIKCSGQTIFAKMASRLFELKPTTQSALFQAISHVKQRKFNEATDFYNQAVNFEQNPTEKAKILYTIATTMCANDNLKAKEYIKRTLNFDSKFGKAYLYLANLYVNSISECGTTEFDKKAIYFLAIETSKKAALVEPRLQSAAEKAVNDYAKLAPTKEDLKKVKKAGKSYTIGCWINETITFPEK